MVPRFPPGFVIILTTPLKASDPYKTELAPLTISTFLLHQQVSLPPYCNSAD